MELNLSQEEKKRVVVTGVGAITPLGNSAPSTWKSALAGLSGAGLITKFETADFPVRFACEVKNFDPFDYFEKKELKRVGEFARFAVVAAQEALQDSALPITAESAVDIGTYIS